MNLKRISPELVGRPGLPPGRSIPGVQVQNWIGYRGFDPLRALPFDAAFWASDPLWSHPSDGVAVTSWRDGSGKGRSADNGSGTNLYRASTAAFGNQPTVEFLGADSLVTSSFTRSQPLTCIAVLSLDTSAAARNWIDSRSVGSVVRAGVSSSDVITLVAPSSVTTDTLTESVSHLVITVFDGASSYTILDGTKSSSVNAGTNGTASGLTIGAAYNAAQRWDGHMAFIGVAPSVITDGMANEYLRWARMKYGTP